MTSRVFHVHTPHLNILPLCCMCACMHVCVCMFTILADVGQVSDDFVGLVSLVRRSRSCKGHG